MSSEQKREVVKLRAACMQQREKHAAQRRIISQSIEQARLLLYCMHFPEVP